MSHLRRVARITDVMRTGEAARPADLSALDHITEMDLAVPFFAAEPLVPLREIVMTTTSMGFLPAALWEADESLGGAARREAIGPLSFRHGSFSAAVLEYETLDAAGEVCRATGRYAGGVLSRVKMRLLPAAPWVLSRWRAADNCGALVEALIDAAANGEVDLLEGQVAGRGRCGLREGRLCATPPAQLPPDACLSDINDYVLDGGVTRPSPRWLPTWLRRPRGAVRQVLLPADRAAGFLDDCALRDASPLRVFPIRGEEGAWWIGCVGLAGRHAGLLVEGARSGGEVRGG